MGDWNNRVGKDLTRGMGKFGKEVINRNWIKMIRLLQKK